MAIYQAPRRRWRLALATGIVGALFGLGVGVAIRSDPDPVQTIQELDRRLSDAASALDVLVIHREADTRSTTDPQVAKDAIRRVRVRVEALRSEMRAVDPDGWRDVDRRLARLDELVREDADPGEIADEAEQLADQLRGFIG